MYNVTSKNLIPLCILQIYEKYSDEMHTLTQEDIAMHLENDYNTTLERKAIGNTVKNLREELDIDIVSGRWGSWLAGRTFEPYELRLLIDSVMSDRYISKKDSDELIKKLCGLSNQYFKSHLKNVIVMDQANKIDNRDLYYNLEVTDEAIESGLDIRFQYFTSMGDETVLTPPRVIRPEVIIFMNQRYYVATRSVPDNELAPVKYYELDKIKNIEAVQREKTGKPHVPLDRKALRKVADDGMTHSFKSTSCRFYAPAFMVKDIKAAFGEDNIILRRLSDKEAAEAAEFFNAEYDVTVNTNIEVFRHFIKMHNGSVKVIRPEKLALWFEMEALRSTREYDQPKGLPILSEKDKRVLRGLSLEAKLELNLPVELGEYQHDTGKGKAPIEWLPVLREEGKALLISKYGIDFAPVKTRWFEKWNDGCKIRKWLNGEFLKRFSGDEKSMLEPFENGDTVSIMPMSYLRTSGYVNNCNIIEPTPFAIQRWKEHGGGEDGIRHFWGTDYVGETVGFSEKSPFGMRHCEFSDCLLRPVIWIKTV